MTTKQVYQQKAEAKLAEKRADIDKARAKAKGAGADARLEADKAVGELEKKYTAAKKKLEQLGDTAEDAWDDVAKGFDDACDDVGGAVKKFFGRLSQ